MSLRHFAISGFKWSFFSQIIRQGLQLFALIIQAKYIPPMDFGLLGMATIATGFLSVFTDLGTSSVIIKHQGNSRILFSTLFWTNVFVGFLSFSTLIFLSPLIGKFYNEPRVNTVLMVLSFSFLISGMNSTHRATLEKELEFNTLAKIDISVAILSTIIGITLAVLGFGVWSLVSQTLSTVTITSIFLWNFSKWRPEFLFSLNYLKTVSSFSLNISAFNILNYIVRNADNLLVGRFLGSQALGYYSLAYRLMLFPIQNIAGLIGKVLFSILSKIQNDDFRIKKVYLKTVSVICLITFPLVICIFVLAEPLVITFLGEKWKPIIKLLMILSPLGILQSVAITVGYIYQIKGRTDWLFRWGLLTSILAIISFFIGLPWGVNGVAISYTIYYLVLFYPCLAIPFNLINLSFNEFIKIIWRPICINFVMLAVLLSFRNLLIFLNISTSLTIYILILTSIFTYSLANWFFNYNQIKEIYGVLRLKLK